MEVGPGWRENGWWAGLLPKYSEGAIYLYKRVWREFRTRVCVLVDEKIVQEVHQPLDK